MKKILLIEDDPHVAAFVKKGLEEESFSVISAPSGEEGLSAFERGSFDLLIVDIMLPGISGLEVCTQVRRQSHLPLLLLTALGTAENVALGLNTGADDYLVKPFKFIELTARVRSLLRRAERIAEPDQGAVLTFAGLSLNDQTKSVHYENAPVSLTATEYRLLFMFMKNARRALSRMDIIDEVWGVQADMSTNVVDVYVNYLRKKLEAAGAPRLIHTITGMGYIMKSEL
ncbi:response regulator transcription factor [Rurimicrobium arvi]|uniref:response regulator transcription factor n=1 Tax=Rurimicrobium arvi TaxID=2049916 RepID=UPI0031D0EFAE